MLGLQSLSYLQWSPYCLYEYMLNIIYNPYARHVRLSSDTIVTMVKSAHGWKENLAENGLKLNFDLKPSFL